MTSEGVKITLISPEEAVDQRDRPGFRSVCQYGSIAPERNEIGCICSATGAPQPTQVPGIWSTPVEVQERIFVVEPC